MPSESLEQLLSAAAILAGIHKTPEATSDTKRSRTTRLNDATSILGAQDSPSTSSRELQTAVLGLSILEQVQAVLDEDQGT